MLPSLSIQINSKFYSSLIDCSNGTFGDLCDNFCHCMGGAACDKITGECPGELCETGYFGASCNLGKFYWLALNTYNVHSISFLIIKYEPVHEISNNVLCATSKASDQPAHMRNLIRAFASRLSNL